MAGDFDARDYVASEPPHFVEGNWSEGDQPLVKVVLEPYFVVPPPPRTLAGRGHIPRYEYTALIDTGASHTVIDRRVAQELRLKSYNWSELYCAGRAKPVRVKQYDVKLTIRALGCSLELTDVYCADLIKGVDCLIGLDILRNGELLIQGLTRTFHFYYFP